MKTHHLVFGWILSTAVMVLLVISVFTGQLINPFAAREKLYVSFQDIGTLKTGDEVKLCGKLIGHVTSIDFDPVKLGVNPAVVVELTRLPEARDALEQLVKQWKEVEKFREKSGEDGGGDIGEDGGEQSGETPPSERSGPIKKPTNIYEYIQLFDYYRVGIDQSSFLGGAFVNINFCRAPAYEALLKAQAISPGEWHRIWWWEKDEAGNWKERCPQLGRGTANALQGATTGNFIDLIARGSSRIDEIVAAVSATAKQIEDITAKINEGEGFLAKMINAPAPGEEPMWDNANDFFSGMKRAAERIDRITEEAEKEQVFTEFAELARKARATVDRLAEALDRIERAEGTLGLLINDRTAYDNFVSVGESLKNIMAKIDSSQGIVGTMINDEQAKREFSDALSAFRAAGQSLQTITGDIQQGEGLLGQLVEDDTLAENVGESIEAINETLGRAAKFKIMVGTEDRYYFDSKVNISKLYLRLYPGSDKRFFQLGGSLVHLDQDGDTLFKRKLYQDKSETFTRLDAQLGFKWLDNTLTTRIGLLEGKFGAGVDYDLYLPFLDDDLRLTLEGRMPYDDIYDDKFDERCGDFQVRAYASMKLFKYFRVTAGANRLLNDPELMLGLAFEYEDEDIRHMLSLMGMSSGF